MIVIHDILDVKNYISEIDAVIFDLDDTLYSEKLYIKSGYKKIAEYFKVPGMENELWLAFEQGKRAIDEVLQRHHLQIWKTEALKILYATRDEKTALKALELLARAAQPF